MNRYAWNYRVEGPAPIPGLVIMETQGGGPMVLPGTYQVRLTVEGKQLTAPLEIKADPRFKVTQAQLQQQYDFALKARDRVSELHKTVMDIRNARASLQKAQPAGNGAAPMDDVQRKMTAIEEQITQVKSTSRDAALVFPIMLDAQYADLANVAESSDAALPAQLFDVFQEYEQRRETLLGQWKQLQQQIAQIPGGTANASDHK